jgi:hypothetical protein
MGLKPKNLPGQHLDSLFRGYMPTVQNRGEFVSYVDEVGIRTVSEVQSDGNSGIILISLQEEGDLKAEFVTRLPADIPRDCQAQLILGSDLNSQGTRRIFISRPVTHFTTHQFSAAEAGTQNHEPVQIPILLER